MQCAVEQPVAGAPRRPVPGCGCATDRQRRGAVVAGVGILGAEAGYRRSLPRSWQQIRSPTPPGAERGRQDAPRAAGLGAVAVSALSTAIRAVGQRRSLRPCRPARQAGPRPRRCAACGADSARGGVSQPGLQLEASASAAGSPPGNPLSHQVLTVIGQRPQLALGGPPAGQRAAPARGALARCRQSANAGRSCHRSARWRRARAISLGGTRTICSPAASRSASSRRDKMPAILHRPPPLRAEPGSAASPGSSAAQVRGVDWSPPSCRPASVHRHHRVRSACAHGSPAPPWTWRLTEPR